MPNSLAWAVRGGIPGVVGKVRLPRLIRGGGGGAASSAGVMVHVGYVPAPPPPIASMTPAASAWALRLVDTVNNTQRGKQNVTLTLTLAANAGMTTLVDSRISAFSFLQFMPLSADAATELIGGAMFVTDQTNGQAVVAHANNSQTDRSFRVLILG